MLKLRPGHARPHPQAKWETANRLWGKKTQEKVPAFHLITKNRIVFKTEWVT